MMPVLRPKAKVGDDAREVLFLSEVALTNANSNLECSRKWYEKVRSGYAVGR